MGLLIKFHKVYSLKILNKTKNHCNVWIKDELIHWVIKNKMQKVGYTTKISHHHEQLNNNYNRFGFNLRQNLIYSEQYFLKTAKNWNCKNFTAAQNFPKLIYLQKLLL